MSNNAKPITGKEKSDVFERFGLDDLHLEVYYGKKKPIELFGKVLGAATDIPNGRVGSATDCELKILLDTETGLVEEYLVVNFGPKTYTVRTARINSNSVNFQEVCRLLNGGYYSELERFKEVCKRSYELSFDESSDGPKAELYHAKDLMPGYHPEEEAE